MIFYSCGSYYMKVEPGTFPVEIGDTETEIEIVLIQRGKFFKRSFGSILTTEQTLLLQQALSEVYVHCMKSLWLKLKK